MEWVSGNIYIRPNRLEHIGDCCRGHAHNFDHTTIVFKGAVRVKATTPDGRKLDKTFKAPAHFLVLKDVEHEITAVEQDTVFWCVYSHRTPQGDVVQEYDGWDKANV